MPPAADQPTPKPPAMTEEERKARKRESARKYREANQEQIRELQRARRAAAPRKERAVLSEEEKTARDRERARQYYLANRQKCIDRAAQWAKDNPEKAREASRKSQGKYRNANPEKVRIAIIKWRKDNQEHESQRKRQWRQDNHDKVVECRREWNAANPEKARSSIKNWEKANPEKVRASGRNAAAIRRARKFNASDHCAPKVTAAATTRRVLLFANSCAYCGTGDGPFHIDHVEPLARGGLHTPSNLVPACQRCNQSKNAKPVEAWYLSQPFFCPDRWDALKRHTGRKWSEVEQLTLLEQHP